MPRVAWIVLPGLPDHVTQRRNNRQPVCFTLDHGFAVANDRTACLDFLPKPI